MAEENNSTTISQEILDELKKNTRRLDTLQKTMDLIHEDRNMLEDIQGRVTQLNESINLNKVNQNQVQKDIKADIKEAQYATEDKVNEVKTLIDEKTIVVKAVREGLMGKILNKLKKKEVQK